MIWQLIIEPWPWYVAGPLIGFVYFMMRYLGKTFGISSTLSDLCSASGCGKKITFFGYNWRNSAWNLLFVAGTLLGGFIASRFLMEGDRVAISQATVTDLKTLGIANPGRHYLPESIFGIAYLFQWKTLIFIVLGGFLIGFGSRYAGGCTSGHGISGLSEWQLPSFIAVTGFFIGGLITTYLLFPLIFKL